MTHRKTQSIYALSAAAVLGAAAVFWSCPTPAAAPKGAKGKKAVAEAAAEMAPAAVDLEKLRGPDDPPDAKLAIDDLFGVDQVVTPKLVAALTAKPPANARRKKIAVRQGPTDPVMDLPMAK